MESEAFYTTAAQVLPTLLIALVIEVSAVMRARERAFEGNREKRMEVGAYWFGMAVVLAVTFLIGETLTLFAIGFHSHQLWTFLLIALSLLIMCVAAAVLPIFHVLVEIEPK